MKEEQITERNLHRQFQVSAILDSMRNSMKNRYRIYVRGKHSGGKVWCCQDNQTGKRESLHTSDKNEARRLLDLKNQPHNVMGFHVQMARTHLLVSDPQSSSRTWQTVMDAIIRQKSGSTKFRWERAAASKPFDAIRNLIVAETKADAFLSVLDNDQVSTNVYLRRLHNFALDMNWLLSPVIAKRAWPKVVYGEKRSITIAEHQKIIEREKNSERRAYYEVCWHVGGSQTDIANLRAEDIDWSKRTLCFNRKKTGSKSISSKTTKPADRRVCAPVTRPKPSGCSMPRMKPTASRT